MGKIINAKKVKKIKGSNKTKFVFCFISGLLWGILIGSLVISILVSYRLDNYYEKVAYLEHIIEDKDDKLSKLEKSINNSNIVLKDITIILEFHNLSKEQIDQVDSIRIEKAIKEKYISLIGKEITNLDADILLQVVDKRILRLKDAEYQLSVKKLVLSDILKLWVEVSVLNVAS